MPAVWFADMTECEPNWIRLTRRGECDMTVRDIPEDNKRIYPHETPHHGWLGL